MKGGKKGQLKKRQSKQTERESAGMKPEAELVKCKKL